MEVKQCMKCSSYEKCSRDHQGMMDYNFNVDHWLRIDCQSYKEDVEKKLVARGW